MIDQKLNVVFKYHSPKISLKNCYVLFIFSKIKSFQGWGQSHLNPNIQRIVLSSEPFLGIFGGWDISRWTLNFWPIINSQCKFAHFRKTNQNWENSTKPVEIFGIDISKCYSFSIPSYYQKLLTRLQMITLYQLD